MARSKGCRPRKADREEVARLRVELGKCYKYDWIKAGCLYDQITTLCRVAGPSGSKMCPRACKYCGYYGHTSQHCEVRQQELDDREAAEWRLLQVHAYKELQEHECSPEQWAFKLKTDRILERYREACALGLGCDGCNVQGTCDGCKKWNAFMECQQPLGS